MAALRRRGSSERGSSIKTTWDDARWTRYGHLAGVLFVVLAVVSAFVADTPPARDASGEEVLKYFADNDGEIKLSAILLGFSIPFGVWWLGSLWRRIGRLEPDGPRLAFIAVIGFILASGGTMVARGLVSAFVLRAEQLAGVGLFVWETSYVMFALSMGALAAHTIALGALTQWAKFLPAWTAYIAYLSGLAGLVAVVGGASTAVFFAVVQFVGFLLWMLWVLIASILLYRESSTP